MHGAQNACPIVLQPVELLIVRLPLHNVTEVQDTGPGLQDIVMIGDGGKNMLLFMSLPSSALCSFMLQLEHNTSPERMPGNAAANVESKDGGEPLAWSIAIVTPKLTNPGIQRNPSPEAPGAPTTLSRSINFQCLNYEGAGCVGTRIMSTSFSSRSGIRRAARAATRCPCAGGATHTPFAVDVPLPIVAAEVPLVRSLSLSSPGGRDR